MTPTQQLNAVAVVLPLGLVFVGELGLLLTRPDWLALLAYMPLGTPRRVLLTPAARAALTSGGTYRDAAVGPLSLSQLAEAPPLVLGSSPVRFDPSGRRATFRLPLGRMFALSGACRIDLVPSRDAIELRARVLPTLAASAAAFFVPFLVIAFADTAQPEGWIAGTVLLVIAVLLQLGGAFRTRMEFGPHVDAVTGAIASRIEALD